MAQQIENVIYILTNTQYPGYIKIGYASNLKQRISSLNTGVLTEFTPFAVYETNRLNADIELHKIIELLNPILRASKFNNGKSKLKEFFKLEPEEAYELLEHIAIMTNTMDRLYKIDSSFNKIENSILIESEAEVKNIPFAKMIVDVNVENNLPDGIYTLDRTIRRDGIDAHGIMMVVNGKGWLKQGSIIAKTESNVKYSHLAYEYRKDKHYCSDGMVLKDIPCNFNTASGIILANTCNIWQGWIDANGNNIDIYRQGKR